MPNSPIWKETRQGRNDVGVLLEVQTVACSDEKQNLGKVWWPLTHAHISKSLQVRENQKRSSWTSHIKNIIQVVLGTEKLNHVRVSNPQLSLNLHDPTFYLSPRNTTRRTLCSHAM